MCSSDSAREICWCEQSGESPVTGDSPLQRSDHCGVIVIRVMFISAQPTGTRWL